MEQGPATPVYARVVLLKIPLAAAAMYCNASDGRPPLQDHVPWQLMTWQCGRGVQKGRVEKEEGRRRRGVEKWVVEPEGREGKRRRKKRGKERVNKSERE